VKRPPAKPRNKGFRKSARYRAEVELLPCENMASGHFVVELVSVSVEELLSCGVGGSAYGLNGAFM
jgi:hypothetical protein